LKAIIIEELTEEEFVKINKKLYSGKKVFVFLEKLYNSFDLEEEYIDTEKLYSFNDNTYLVKTIIYNDDFDKIGYLLIKNTKENVEIIKKNNDFFCIKCGSSLSTEVPFGELSFKQLGKIKNKDNCKSCHSCLRIVEVIDDKEITIKNSVILKLRIK
jgi:hypothetical protein